MIESTKPYGTLYNANRFNRHVYYCPIFMEKIKKLSRWTIVEVFVYVRCCHIRVSIIENYCLNTVYSINLYLNNWSLTSKFPPKCNVFPKA